MQNFKGDATELKFRASGEGILDLLTIQLDAFYDGAYSAAPLGDVLYDTERSPLANAIDRDIFRNSFDEIFQAFIVSGSFESYLTVFNKIFGAEVEVAFTVPAPGKLQIAIEADEVELSPWVARTIQDNLYVFDEMIEEDSGDNICFQTIKGFKTQYELEQMLYELVPAGIYTEITLTLA